MISSSDTFFLQCSPTLKQGAGIVTFIYNALFKFYTKNNILIIRWDDTFFFKGVRLSCVNIDCYIVVVFLWDLLIFNHLYFPNAFIFGRLYLIKYDHNTYDGRTQKIPLEDTIVLLPEEKENRCQRDNKCWHMPGAWTCIVIDDGVTSMRNAFDRDNAMFGKITFFENLPFLTTDDWTTR